MNHLLANTKTCGRASSSCCLLRKLAIRTTIVIALTLTLQVSNACPDKNAACKNKQGERTAANLNPQCLRAGLVAHYPFDGDPGDSSGEHGPLTVDHAIFTTDRFGIKNSAYQFDGTKSSMKSTVKNFPDYRSPQSYSWWFYTRELQTYALENGAGNMIVLADVESGSGLQFGFRAPGYRTLGLDTWMWGGGTLLEVKPPAAKTWHHCVYTFDGRTNRFYLDGFEIATSTVKPQEGAPTQLMLGNYPTGDQFFRGKLDDIRIYNRTLSRLEIESLFQVTR